MRPVRGRCRSTRIQSAEAKCRSMRARTSSRPRRESSFRMRFVATVRATALLLVVVSIVTGCAAPVAPAPAPQRHQVDLIIRNGEIYDGRGGEPVRQNLAVDEGRVVAVGTLDGYEAKQTVDAQGLAV